mmetsp:Transcript_39391/g.103938  ORF Transcript_39391/g.103938 Transcript_39391/m.103938 type:complete len:280 (+) Transcript_39391:586-1425(+)
MVVEVLAACNHLICGPAAEAVYGPLHVGPVALVDVDYVPLEYDRRVEGLDQCASLLESCFAASGERVWHERLGEGALLPLRILHLARHAQDAVAVRELIEHEHLQLGERELGRMVVVCAELRHALKVGCVLAYDEMALLVAQQGIRPVAARVKNEARHQARRCLSSWVELELGECVGTAREEVYVRCDHRVAQRPVDIEPPALVQSLDVCLRRLERVPLLPNEKAQQPQVVPHLGRGCETAVLKHGCVALRTHPCERSLDHRGQLGQTDGGKGLELTVK